VPEVFISYSQRNRELVAPIARRLEELGVDAWFDREISAGESFGAVIRAKLKEAKAIVVCWSPEATQSEWVDAEADYAREVGTYVPVFIAPCGLLPPFNRIQTDDLSNWAHSPNDPAWLKLVNRIAKLVGRDGVAAAAAAYASGDETILYDFARRFPEEPAAQRIWRDAEPRHRKEFDARLEEARTVAGARVARITAEATDLEARIEATAPAFEAWLEQRGAVASKPDPMALVKRYVPVEERKLRAEVAALSSALVEAKANEEQLEAAKGQIANLSDKLDAECGKTQLLQVEAATLSNAIAEAKAQKEELSAAKAQIARLSAKLAELTTQNVSADAERYVGSRPVASKVSRKSSSRDITRLLVGESLIGEGNEVAKIDLIIGPRGSRVEAMFATALTNNTQGFTSLLALLAPNLATKPSTVMFNKVKMDGAKQLVQMFGPAQYAVAKAVADSVADGTIPANQACDLFICVGVFIHREAVDDRKIRDYNYRATKEALERAVAGDPTATEVVAQRNAVKSQFEP
jgi:5,6,7,8-tetrahydromethanopterin hydro-lyase